MASALAAAAEAGPQTIAVRWPGTRAGEWRKLTFAELAARSSAIAHGLVARGLERGDRVALFVRPGPELVALTFALFAIGAVPVLVDPGMGRQALVSCLARARPRALIGVLLAQLVRVLHARALSGIEIAISVGPRWWRLGTPIEEIARPSLGAFTALDTRADDTAAILFTSGSTGPARGVVYTHGMFAAQVRELRSMYAFAPGQIDLACFPLFALFDVALERTSVFPRLDPSRPGCCDPASIVAAIVENQISDTFGSPAIWRRVVPWCRAHGVALPSLERAMIAGAPVSPALIEEFRMLLASTGDVHTPYGATEALPVATISGREIAGDVRAKTESGFGTCVGRAAPGIELALIRISDNSIASWNEVDRVRAGELGEVCVRGAVVTQLYDADPDATAKAKIADGKDVWHRMGDIGYQDDEGRLWFCGRKSDRIETTGGLVLPVPAENIYDRHPAVARSAVVGIGARGNQRAVLVIEPRSRAPLRHELSAWRERAVSKELPHALPAIEHVLVRRSFPLDVRHNAKIRRDELARWAERKLS